MQQFQDITQSIPKSTAIFASFYELATTLTDHIQKQDDN
jgi:hypothetical protein